MEPVVSKIFIYPVKSFDHVELNEVTIGKRCLLHDREFAVFNQEGKYVNGKRTPRINELRSAFDMSDYSVTFNLNGDLISEKFNLLNDKVQIENYLSEFFGYRVNLSRNDEGKFLDIPDDSGITVSSESSLSALMVYFPEINIEQMRLRFRANIEFTGTEPFWEDRLFSKPGNVIEFNINEVKLFGISPRARCIVPTRDSLTGITYPRFTKKFSEARKKTLPEWSELNEYDHYYYLNVDVLIPDSETGKKIRLGDSINIIGEKKISSI